MAVVLDDRCRAAVARRHARGKDARLFLRFERGSARAGVPWVVAPGWAHRRLLPKDVEVQRIGEKEVHVEARIARYCRGHDLVMSAARFGPFEWLLMDDQYAPDLIRVWERSIETMESVSYQASVAEKPDREPLVPAGTRQYRRRGREAG